MEELELYKQRYTSVEANRNTYIGGSDIGTILGLNPYKSAYTLYLEKTGQLEPKDISDEEPVWWGTEMEDLVAKRFFQKTKEAGLELSVKKTTFEFRSKKYPFLVAHIDRQVFDYKKNEFDRTGLECKTTSSWNKTDYGDGEIPPAHYAQVQFYMMMTGSAYWYYAVKRDAEFYWCRVERNDEYIEAMLKAAIDFWKHVETKDGGIDLDGSDSTKKSLHEMYSDPVDDVIEMSADSDDATLNALESTKAAIKALKEEQTRLENEVKARLGNNTVGINNNFNITWKMQNGKPSISEDLKKDHPDIYEKYIIRNSSRVLRVTRKKVKK